MLEVRQNQILCTPIKLAAEISIDKNSHKRCAKSPILRATHGATLYVWQTLPLIPHPLFLICNIPALPFALTSHPLPPLFYTSNIPAPPIALLLQLRSIVCWREIYTGQPSKCKRAILQHRLPHSNCTLCHLCFSLVIFQHRLSHVDACGCGLIPQAELVAPSKFSVYVIWLCLQKWCCVSVCENTSCASTNICGTRGLAFPAIMSLRQCLWGH